MPGACLYLTAWTAAVSWALVPVLVWIHARFGLGNSADIAYGGAALAGRGVVLVTINSRLGALDYLAPASLRAESDHGASDDYVTLYQIAALAWIRANVADVGENPDGVTIFGESAGS